MKLYIFLLISCCAAWCGASEQKSNNQQANDELFISALQRADFATVKTLATQRNVDQVYTFKIGGKQEALSPLEFVSAQSALAMSDSTRLNYCAITAHLLQLCTTTPKSEPNPSHLPVVTISAEQLAFTCRGLGELPPIQSIAQEETKKPDKKTPKKKKEKPLHYRNGFYLTWCRLC